MGKFSGKVIDAEIDKPDEEDMQALTDLPPTATLPSSEEKEQGMMDSPVLVGFPREKYERRRAWLSLPRSARAAIRRMHRILPHQPRSAMLRILKGAGADPQLIVVVKHSRCPDCPEEHTRSQPLMAPSLYIFYYEVVVDVFESVDDENERYSCLSCVCNGTAFHLVWMVREGGDQPKSFKLLSKLLNGLVS